MAKASEYVDITVGRGEAHYPSVHRESTFKGAPTGRYECGIILTGEALEAAKAAIEAFISDTFSAKKAAACERPWRVKDGKSILQFSTFAKAKDGTPKSVRLYDAKGNLVERPVALGNGSIIRIKGSMGTGEAKDGGDKVRLYLNSVQIIKLKEFVSGGSGGGFEADEGDGDGWVADEFDGSDGADNASETPKGSSGKPSKSADF